MVRRLFVFVRGEPAWRDTGMLGKQPAGVCYFSSFVSVNAVQPRAALRKRLTCETSGGDAAEASPRSTHLFIVRSTVFYPVAWVNLGAGVVLLVLLVQERLTRGRGTKK